EVHVAEMVLVAEDIGQYGVAFRVLDKTHGDTGHRRLEGHTGVHQGEAGTAHRGHGAGAIGFGDLRHDPQGVGEGVEARQHGGNAAPREAAVAHFAAAGKADATALTHRVGGEVVVEHEGVLAL